MFNDFEYDGIRLSGYGYIICDFETSSGIKIVTNGADIKFKITPILKGNLHMSTGTEYTDCLTTKINICKNPCFFDDRQIDVISVEEITKIVRWLSRKEYKKFKLINNYGYEQIYYEGTFSSINRIIIGDKVVGLELTLTTNRPFGLYEPLTKKLEFSTPKQELIFRDISDEIGFINAKTIITCKSSGNLIIHNSIEDRNTIINNCANGEVITMDYPNILSSNPSHRLQDDFNFNFFRIANKWDNSVNKVTASLPCVIKFTYSPIRKVGV